jgi:hypothetical protein
LKTLQVSFLSIYGPAFTQSETEPILDSNLQVFYFLAGGTPSIPNAAS